MKVAVVGLDRKMFEKKLPKDFFIDRKKPEIVFSFGGDGTILYSERLYPGIPKIFVRHSRFCKKCEVVGSYKKLFDALRRGKYKIVEEIKLEGVVNGSRKKMLVGLNEINVCSRMPMKAVRLQLFVNGRCVQREVVGDGIVVATPFGSTAYFYSVTRKTFSRGIGIAFNNSRVPIRHMVVAENSTIRIKVLRGDAVMCADNNKKVFRLKAGDVVTVKKSRLKARLVKFKK
jgi:NAD+ kinase